MRTLYLLPARAGSKGLPGKNTMDFCGKPLISHSIEIAKAGAHEGDLICVSTNDPKVVEIADQLGVPVPFMRPEQLCTDEAGSLEVIRHAIDFFAAGGKTFDAVMLLQPTSPLRVKRDLMEIKNLFEKHGPDMVVSVKESKANPYFNLFEESAEGLIVKSKEGNFTRRQDCPKVYEINGAFYLIDASVVMKKKISEFDRVIKYVMPVERSVDIDDIQDWRQAELNYKYVLNENG